MFWRPGQSHISYIGSLRPGVDKQLPRIPSVSGRYPPRFFSYTPHPSTRFALAAKVEDFSAKDIFIPERERTIILLSAFINFIKFTEQFCGALVNDLRERSEAIIVERDQIAEKLEIVQRNIDILK